MKTKELEVLKGFGLIPQYLIEGFANIPAAYKDADCWLTAQLQSISKNEEACGFMKRMWAVFATVLAIIAGCVYMTRVPLSGISAGLGILCAIFACVYAIAEKITRSMADKDPRCFWNKLSVLAGETNLTLAKILMCSKNEVIDQCAMRLIYHAKMVLSAEAYYGKVSGDADMARSQFKMAHAIFLEFKLVQPMHDSYFNAAAERRELDIRDKKAEPATA